jgi:DNA-binding MarR family transcriptional regulator
LEDPLDLEAAKRASTLQLLIRAARLVDERARGRINDEAGRQIARPSTMALFPHIALEGTRIVDLADRLQITKQAVSKRVGELVEHGIVEVVADPADGRAKLVRFTAHGLAAIHHGLGVLNGIERELAERIGTERMTALRETLDLLNENLDRLA